MHSRRPRFRPFLEQLDDRIVPSLTVTGDSAGNVTVSGTPTNPTVTIQAVGTDTYDIRDGATSLVGGMAYIPGNIRVILGAATTAALNNTTLNLDTNGFDMNASFTLDMGVGDDTVQFQNTAGGINTIFGSIYGRGVNTWNQDVAFPDAVDVAGNITIDASFESRIGDYSFVNTIIGGSVNIISGSNSDNVEFGAFAIVNGSVTLQLGNGANGLTTDLDSIIDGRLQVTTGTGQDSVGLSGTIGADAIFNLGNGNNSLDFTGTISGWFSYTGGYNSDDVTLGDGITGAFIGGNISVNLGNGANTLVFDADASIGGLTFNIIGGAGTDDITFSGDLSFTRVSASLGASSDSVTINITVMLPVYMYIDFGAGVDSLVTFVPLPPSYTFRNLP